MIIIVVVIIVYIITIMIIVYIVVCLFVSRVILCPQILHRDISTRNILVTEGFTIKVSDFGFARDISQTEYYRKMTDVRLHACMRLQVHVEYTHTHACDASCLLLESWLLCSTPL